MSLTPHRALQIYEIREEICQQLRFGVYTRGDDAPNWKRDLARLARCSVAFSQPALDALWRELFSVAPVSWLIRIMHADMGTVRRDPETSVYSSPWPERFHEYTARIRILNAIGDDDIFAEFAEGFYARMRLGEDYIFPRLHTLTSIGLLLGFATKIAAFLSPSLRCLGINMIGRSNPEGLSALSAFCSTLVQRTPLLQELGLFGIAARIPLDFAAEFYHLRRLTVRPGGATDPVSSQLTVLRELSCREHLVHLEIPLFGISAGNLIGWTGYPALRVLHVSDMEANLLAYLLIDQLTTPNLESFLVDGRQVGHWTGIRSCINKLALRFSSSLHCISVNLLDTQLQNREKVVALQAFQPLLQLPLLSRLRIIIPGLILAMDDNDFEQLVGALPQLTALSLHHVEGITCHSLSSVVRHCPELVQLDLRAIDIRVVPDIQSLPVSSHRLSGLRIEWAQKLREEDKAQVEEIKRRCFPFL